MSRCQTGVEFPGSRHDRRGCYRASRSFTGLRNSPSRLTAIDMSRGGTSVKRQYAVAEHFYASRGLGGTIGSHARRQNGPLEIPVGEIIRMAEYFPRLIIEC